MSFLAASVRTGSGIDKSRIEAETTRLRPWVAVAAVAGALLLQAYLPLFSTYANMADLPLLVTIYLALLRRSPVAGLGLGMAIGLAQDSLSPQSPVGMYGIIKTMIGYSCSSLTSVLEVSSMAARVVLVLVFYWMHQILFWTLQRVLMPQSADFAWERTLFLGIINTALAVPVFQLLDRLREPI
jgi:rod shape-determining protein MreD